MKQLRKEIFVRLIIYLICVALLVLIVGLVVPIIDVDTRVDEEQFEIVHHLKLVHGMAEWHLRNNGAYPDSLKGFSANGMHLDGVELEYLITRKLKKIYFIYTPNPDDPILLSTKHGDFERRIAITKKGEVIEMDR